MDFVELAAITIHDVKNRLSILASRAEARGDAETVRGAMEAALTLTRLLAAYKSDKGRLGAAIDAHAPTDLLQELAAEAGKLTGLAIRLDAAGAPTLGFYDEALVRLVLRDALYNAMRHAATELRLAARLHDGCLEFTVSDDGPGYPTALLGQPAAMQALSEEGTGLGLYLAGRVARLHDNAGRQGGVDLGNAAGAVFTLRLPQ
jgi:two-component system sensor histidine kinase SenX3